MRKRFSYRYWSEADLARVVQLRNQGWDNKRIAAEFNVRECSIVSLVKRYKLIHTGRQDLRGIDTRAAVLDRLCIKPTRYKELMRVAGICNTQLFRILSEFMAAGIVRRARFGVYEYVPGKEN